MTSLADGLLGERVEPEGATQGAVGFEGAVDALGDDMVDVAVGDDGVAVGDHGSEHAVAHLDPKVVQVACEVLALGLRVDVFHDAQEVARIDAVGQRLGRELRVEDRDPGEDGVEGMAGDGDANGALRIEQPEAREVRVEQVEHLRSAPGFARASGALQSLDGFSQLAPGLGDLLVGGLVGVEVDARASAAVGAGSMIGGASPDLHDDADEGGGESEGSAAGVEDEIGQDLGEQAEGPFDMGFVLRAARAWRGCGGCRRGRGRPRGCDWRDGCRAAAREGAGPW